MAHFGDSDAPYRCSPDLLISRSLFVFQRFTQAGTPLALTSPILCGIAHRATH